MVRNLNGHLMIGILVLKQTVTQNGNLRALRVFLVAQMVKNQPLMWETWIEKGNDKSLQYSCLENPIDRRNQWATVHAVVKSWA